MKTYMVQQQEGERMGDLDYSYNFLQHYANYGSTEEWKKERCEKTVEMLKEVEKLLKEGKKIMVDMSGYRKELFDVGMYDGWPYWKPTPALLVKGNWSAEWEFFYNLQGFEITK